MQYFNYGGGLFYTQRSFHRSQHRLDRWRVRRVFDPRDYLQLFAGAATRGSH
jgi:hypothetical protein